VVVFPTPPFWLAIASVGKKSSSLSTPDNYQSYLIA